MSRFATVPDADKSDTCTADRSRIGLAIAVIALALVGGSRLGSGSLWVDEAWSLGAFRHLGMSYGVSGGSMLGYYVLMWPLARVSQAMWWLRAPSLVAGIATLVIVHRIGRLVSGRFVAAIAPLLLVGSPMFLWKATEVRAYGIETLLTALCWLALVTLVSNPRARWSGPLLLTGALVGPWFHGLFALQVAGMVVAALFIRNRRVTRWAACGLALSVGGGLAARMLHGDAVGARLLGGFRALFEVVSKSYLSPNQFVAIVIGLAAVVGLVASAPSKSGHTALRGSLVPAAWVLVPLIGSLVVRRIDWVFDARYLAPSTPGIALLAAEGLRVAGTRLTQMRLVPRKTAQRWISVPALLVVLIVWGGQISTPPGNVEGWRSAAALVAAQVRPGDAIVFVGGINNTTIADRAAFEAAWTAAPRRVTPESISPARPLADVRRVDVYLDGPAIRRAAARHPRVWYVDYHSLFAEHLNPGGNAFPHGYHRAVDRVFAGAVSVYRYDRPAPTN